MRTAAAPSFKQALRSGVGVIVGIAGGSSSGKTLSALKVARGLADGKDEEIAFIDTESGRAKYYAVGRGEKPSEFRFGFSHCDLGAPFTPEAYREKIVEADEAGFSVIVIDSFSHEWEGDGGLTEIHDELAAQMVERARKKAEGNNWNFDQDYETNKASVPAWKAPKLRHKKLVSRLLQCRAHLVICMRAEDKMRMETKTEAGRGGREYKKAEIIPASDLPPKKRWQPICERRFPFEIPVSLLLTADAPGVPIPVRDFTPDLAAIIPTDRPLTEEVGRRLAAWMGHERQSSTTPGGSFQPPAEAKGPVPPSQGPGADAAGQRNASGGKGRNPAEPEALPPPADNESDKVWKRHASEVRDLMSKSGSRAIALRWWALNEKPIANISRPLASWVEQAIPDEVPAELAEADDGIPF